MEEVTKAIDVTAAYKSSKAEHLKKNYDSMSKISFKIKNLQKTIGNENRVKVLKARDSINNKYKLYLKFMHPNTYENIDDSLFNTTVKIDFLRLTEAFQLRYVLPRSVCISTNDM